MYVHCHNSVSSQANPKCMRAHIDLVVRKLIKHVHIYTWAFTHLGVSCWPLLLSSLNQIPGTGPNNLNESAPLKFCPFQLTAENSLSSINYR